MYNKYRETHKGLLKSNPQADRVSRKVSKGLRFDRVIYYDVE